MKFVLIDNKICVWAILDQKDCEMAPKNQDSIKCSKPKGTVARELFNVIHKNFDTDAFCMQVIKKTYWYINMCSYGRILCIKYEYYV